MGTSVVNEVQRDAVLAQIEDLSQQAQMAAAEKFKAPEQPTVEGETPTAAVRPVHESDEEEVSEQMTHYSRHHYQQQCSNLGCWHQSQTARNVLRSRASVCLTVCLSAAACPHYCTDPGVTWGSGRDAP